MEEIFGAAEPSPQPSPSGRGSTAVSLGRETKGEVVLVSRLRAALERLNPALPPDAITAAVDELTRDRSAMSLEAANREVYLCLKNGIKVFVPDTEGGGQKPERVRVVDWEHPANNDFLLVSQMSITGALYTCRPDLIAFVNGLPLVVTELKKPGVPARAAFGENLTHYKQQIPALFWYNALLIASNGTDSRVGSLTADWERFFEWKRIVREDEPRRVSLEVMIRGDLRQGAVARPGGEFHAVFRTQGGTGQDHRPEHPHPTRAGTNRRRAGGGEESRPRASHPAQATAGPQLAAEIQCPVATQARH
jgi:type I site-specific restriction-modification system R (restriction) subunit